MADATDPFPDLRSVYKVSSRRVNRLSQNVAVMKLASAQDGDKENSVESDNKVAVHIGHSKDSTPNKRLLKKPGQLKILFLGRNKVIEHGKIV
ncbi:hypothetical protein V6N13_090198 [Hibiscus sabdariffa]